MDQFQVIFNGLSKEIYENMTDQASLVAKLKRYWCQSQSDLPQFRLTVPGENIAKHGNRNLSRTHCKEVNLGHDILPGGYRDGSMIDKIYKIRY